MGVIDDAASFACNGAKSRPYPPQKLRSGCLLFPQLSSRQYQCKMAWEGLDGMGGGEGGKAEVPRS